jgi:hypothetical protein
MISVPGTLWDCIGSLDMQGIRGDEIADKLLRDGTVQKFVGTELSLGVSRQNARRKIKGWMDNQRLLMWCSIKVLRGKLDN